jgi:hypothetical protein
MLNTQYISSNGDQSQISMCGGWWVVGDALRTLYRSHIRASELSPRCPRIFKIGAGLPRFTCLPCCQLSSPTLRPTIIILLMLTKEI